MGQDGVDDNSITSLFPGYLFACFDLQQRYFEVRYMPGVQGIVSAGNDPLTVPVAVIDEIRSRGTNGVVALARAKSLNSDILGS